MKRKLTINIGKLFGILLYVLAVNQRRLVSRNLRFCYPEWSDDQIKKLARRVFKNFGITFIEVCQSAFMSWDSLSSRYRVKSVSKSNIIFPLYGASSRIRTEDHLLNRQAL